MKKSITILAILLCTSTIIAQNVTYDLRWNSSSSLYELYVERDVSAVAPVTTGGTAVVTIVFPTDGAAGTRTLTHTSESVSAFNPAGVIRSPSASATNDYYVFNYGGGASYIGVLNADVEVLWMTFTPSDGNSEARLFVNDSDPNSDGTGMMGINARSSFFTVTSGGLVNEFGGNVLNVQGKDLQQLTLYPNPASDIVNISSNVPIDRIEVYNLLGKQVRTLKQTKVVNVSDLKSGMYLFKVFSGNQIQLKKIVVK